MAFGVSAGAGPRRVSVRRTRPSLPIVLAAGASALVFAGLAYKAGVVVAFGGLAGLLLIGVLLNDARLATLVALGVFVLIEDDAAAGWGAVPFLYNTASTKISPFIGLVLVALGATILAVRGIGLRSPRPFVVPLGLIACAELFGIVNGVVGYQSPKFTVLGTVAVILPLLIMPVVIVNLVRDPPQLRQAIGIGGALAVVKSALGLAVTFGGLSAPVAGIGQLTFLEPTGNELEMVFLFGVLAARLRGVALPRWASWGWPIVLISFIVGYRRFFWLAAALGFVLILLIATRRVGRRMIVPAALLFAVCGYIVLSTGVGNSLDGEVIKRASTISVTHATHNTQDRYRIAERRNVIAAIERQPFTGLGVGVDWPERYPLPFEVAGLHNFTHVAFLYWWMTDGPLGALAYLVLMASGVIAGLRVWFRHPDPLVRVTGLAIGVGVIGLTVTELASTTIGSDQRGTALLGVMLGLLAAAHRQIGRPDPAATAFPAGTIEQR